jgi:hypothetical protein
MVLLCLAWALVELVPLGWWRGTLSPPAEPGKPSGDAGEARRWAAHVERAAMRLPFAIKCLPQAVALSWLLSRRGIAHQLVIAVRPADRRQEDNALHAWVESAGRRILGDLPGPWFETARFGG